MHDLFSSSPPDDGDADLWAALGLEDTPIAERLPAWALPPDEADDLEMVVRRHGGRLPGSDPRR